MLVSAGARLNTLAFNDGMTALTVACMPHADKTSLGALLRAGADPHIMSTRQGQGGIHLASYLGNLEAVRQLLEHGVHVDARDRKGVTPIMHACGEGQIEIVELLWSRGADIHQKCDRGRTALSYAARQNSIPAAQFLLDHGAHIDDQDVEGRVPLAYAAMQGRIEMVHFLLGAGASIRNSRTGTCALVCACDDDQHEAAEILIDAGADLALKVTQYELTPLAFAVVNTDLPSARLLLQNGADPNLQDDKVGQTALHTAVMKNSAGLVALLLNYGGSPNARDAAGSTPLFAASRRGHADIVMHLLSSGAAAEIGNLDGFSPLYVAAQQGHVDVMRLLLEHGALVNGVVERNPLGFSPIMVCDDPIALKVNRCCFVKWTAKNFSLLKHLLWQACGVSRSKTQGNFHVYSTHSGRSCFKPEMVSPVTL